MNTKKNYYTRIAVALLMLCNPNIHVFDFLPDFLTRKSRRQPQNKRRNKHRKQQGGNHIRGFYLSYSKHIGAYQNYDQRSRHGHIGDTNLGKKLGGKESENGKDSLINQHEHR